MFTRVPHAKAPSADETHWAQIVALYDVLRRIDPSPVVALNRAAALGMREGTTEGRISIKHRLGSIVFPYQTLPNQPVTAACILSQ